MYYIVLTVGAAIVLIPFCVMISTSLKTFTETLAYPPTLWPNGELQWGNYAEIFEKLPFGRYIANSLLVTSVITVGQLFVSSLSAFAFARLRFPGRDALFMLFLMTMMIPGQVTLIPLFVLMRSFGWVDTYAALMVPGMFEAFGTFLLRQFFLTIPASLEEAAELDGCSKLRIYWQLILPLSKPALATLGAFVFMKWWNELLWPLIVTHTEEMKVLSVGLATLADLYYTQWHLVMAGATVGFIPLLVLYVFLQRYFEQGIVLTGIKG